jgi:hypothetical protein
MRAVLTGLAFGVATLAAVAAADDATITIDATSDAY